MIALWGQLIRPLVEAVEGREILEIGAEYGLSTKVLLNFVREVGGHLHCIDPVPGFDVSEFVAANEGFLSFYEDLSLDALKVIPRVDVALVDGDHNWYTVYNELKMIEQTHGNDPAAMPLTILHDIGWPYGRRDLYYDPSTVPEEFVQPYARRGIGRKNKELLASGGMNGTLCNAITEGGPRNGVLTGVEDYIRESAIDFEFLNLPLYHGLGVLIPRQRLETNDRLRQEYETLKRYMEGEKLVRLVENIRLNMGIGMQRLQGELDQSQARVVELEAQLAQSQAPEPDGA